MFKFRIVTQEAFSHKALSGNGKITAKLKGGEQASKHRQCSFKDSNG
jgi:hypothetical protein